MLNHTPTDKLETAVPARSLRTMLRLGNLGRPLDLPAHLADAFHRALAALNAAHIPYSVGGGLAVYAYTGEHRNVHDLDLHLPPSEVEAALEALQTAGFTTWIRLQPWLAQGQYGETQVDLVYGQGSWHASVDLDWVERGCPAHLLGEEVRIAPAEEILWSKALRLARVRSDQSDVFHLLLTVGPELDWNHLLRRFGEDWEVLLSHLILFRYVFPSEGACVPARVMDELLERLQKDRAVPYTGPRLCRGTVVDTSGPYEHYPDLGFVDEGKRRWEQRLQVEPVLHRLVRTYVPPEDHDECGG